MAAVSAAEGDVGLFELCNPHLLATDLLQVTSWSHFQFEPFPAQRLLLPLHLRPSEREEAVYLARSHLSPRYSAHLKCNCHVWTAPLFDSLNSGLRGGNEGEVRGVRREEMERLLLKSWLMETLSSRSRQRRSWKSDWKPNLATPMQGRKGKAAQSVPKLPGHNSHESKIILAIIISLWANN